MRTVGELRKHLEDYGDDTSVCLLIRDEVDELYNAELIVAGCTSAAVIFAPGSEIPAALPRNPQRENP